MSMQVPFVGFQPIRTSEHMAAAGMREIVVGIRFLMEFGMVPECSEYRAKIIQVRHRSFVRSKCLNDNICYDNHTTTQ